MSLVRLQNVTKRYDDRVVLREVSLKIAAGERVGLIGSNGSGKTTILRLMLGREEPDSGKVDVNIDTQVGYFSQFSELSGDKSIQSILEDLFADVKAIELELESIGSALGEVTDGDEMERLLDRQAHLLEEMNRRDGWDYPRHIDTALTKLSFNVERRNLPVDQLSGGWRNRAALAKILLEGPDVLLLDEPTNYLDVDGLKWLEDWVNAYQGGLLIVSHDRQFLDQVVTRMVEIESYHLHDYPGNYTDYVRAKPFRIKNQQRQFEFEEELLILENEAVSDRQELSKTNDPQTLRKLADIKKRRPLRPTENIVTDIYAGLRVPDQLCTVQGLTKRYGDTQLFSDVSFELGKGERLGIVGANGSGKSTLLRAITGVEKPDDGKVTWLSSTKFASFNQIESELDPKETVTHAVNVYGMGLTATKKQVNRFLTLLQFTEADLQQKIGALSGGQRARVALARALLSGCAVLVLDEPTNHLDLASTQVMEQALLRFPGAVIVVSHDRFFLDKIATRLIVFEDGKVRLIQGNWIFSSD